MTDAHLPLLARLPAALQQAIETYDAWSQKHLLEEQAKEVVGQPLYQYTNAAGLKGIFDSQQMWFTDYRFLNDPSELSHGMDMARDMLLDAQTDLDGRAVGSSNAPPICSAVKTWKRRLRFSSRASAGLVMTWVSGAPTQTMVGDLPLASLHACSASRMNRIHLLMKMRS